MDNLPSQGIASITMLAFSPDGSLYFARPATSQIMRLPPDGKGFFGPPQTFAADLPEPPNGLTYDDKDGPTWYVSSDTMIVRLRDRDGDGTVHGESEQEIIVKGLPGGVGRWLGNVRVGPDRRLYVAKGGACDTCTAADPRQGTLMSFTLDGSDMRVVARGLRDSYDFDWNPIDGTLYIVDNERPDLPAELNAITPDQLKSGQPVDFGWPRCAPDRKPVSQEIDPADCARTTPPVLTFPMGSHPMGAAFYTGQAFPVFKNNLFVALSGSWNGKTTTGFAVMRVTFGADGKLTGSEQWLPDQAMKPTLSDASLYRISFYPYHPTGIAFSREGWIYVSESEGQILRFRPRPAG